MSEEQSSQSGIPHQPVKPYSTNDDSGKLTPREQAVISKLFRRLIPFLFVLFVFSFLDRINIGFAGLTMSQDLGLSSTMFGMATTLFYAMYVIFGIPSNIMLGIVGARRWIAIIMVIWGIASTATMFATGPNSLYILRMLVGIAEAGFLPGLLLYLTYWFPANYRARANALFIVAIPVTMTLGSLVSGYILSMDGLMSLRGWQWMFLLEGFPSVLLGVLVWFCLDDSPNNAKWMTEDDKSCLNEMMVKDKTSLVQLHNNKYLIAHQRSKSKIWHDVFTPTIMLYTLAYFFLCNSLSALTVWTPLILKSFNQESSNITIGILSAVPNAFTIIAMIWWSKRSDRLQERKLHTLLPCLFAAAGWLLAAHGPGSTMQLLGLTMASACSFSAMAIFWTTPDQSISIQARAVGIALINATGNLGSAASPLLIGWLRDITGSFSAGFYLVSGFLALGALVVAKIPMVSRPRTHL